MEERKEKENNAMLTILTKLIEKIKTKQKQKENTKAFSFWYPNMLAWGQK